MGGGDGRDHNTDAHNTSGNINGSLIGLGAGGGASGGSGWSSENNPWGGGPGSGIHWGGGSGHDSGGGNGSSGGGSGTSGNLSAVAASVVFGFLAFSTPGVGGLVVSISAGALSAAIADTITALKGPFKFDLWGVALYGVSLSQVARDDPNMMSKIMTSLPADDIAESPVSSLPLNKATVNVNVRVIDDVKDERQNISIVSGVLMSIPAVDAKPTERPDVFATLIPGIPVLNISVNNSTPTIQTLSPGITSNADRDVRPAGFIQGGSTRDTVIRFPKGNGHNTIYVPVSDVLGPDQAKQRQDGKNRRQQEWDATHPVRVAERNYERARAELNQANEDVAGNQERQAKTVQVYNSRKSGLDTTDKTLADVIAKTKRFDRFAHSPMAGGHRIWQMAGLKTQRARTNVNSKQAAFDTVAKERSDVDAALSAAQERYRQKENKEKDAKDKLDKESKRNRPGKTTGRGRPVSDEWLNDTGKDSRAPTPDRIANRLRDKGFENLDDFRKKF